jgi:hypothetical protein
MKSIGKSVLQSANNVSAPKKQDDKQFEKFLEQKKSKKTQDSEERVQYKIPDAEGMPTDKQLRQQKAELLSEKSAAKEQNDNMEENSE